MTDAANVPRITEPNDVLLRQVIPQWTNDDGTPQSVAFKPTPKDLQRLSTDYEVDPAVAFDGYTKRVGHAPEGTWGLGVGTVLSCHADLEIVKDGGTDDLHESHASIVFPSAGSSGGSLRKVYERIAKSLKAEAIKRQRLYPPA